MSEQLIISVSREFASGGREIAKILAERFGISFYDKNLLVEIAAEKLGDVEKLKKFDEVPKLSFMYRTVRGATNSPEEIVANFQFDYLRRKAQEGESFVIVGRCAEEVLSEYPQMVRLFVLGDEADKLQRVCMERHVNEDEARGIMLRHDRKRKQYHNYYCSNKWGDSRGYDLCINSSRLGIEKTADFLEEYVRMRTAREETENR